jgi:glycosyltransferase involved in cell wall biosynthesis
MKILFVHNYYKFSGGEDQVFIAEMNLMKTHGHEVYSYSVNNDKINSVFAKIHTAVNLAYSTKSKNEFSKILNEFNPDIVHCHNFFPRLTPSIFDACIEAKIPSVLTLHNYRLVCPSVYLMKNNKPWELSIHKNPYYTIPFKVYKNSYFGTATIAYMINYHKRKNTWGKKIDKIISLTMFGKNKFIEAGFSPNNMVTKPNFISDPYNKHYHREKFSLFIGRISSEKGINFLLDAWENIDFSLKIVGDGPLLEKLSKTNKNIHFLGKIPNESVKVLLQQAQFLVFPSQWYEGFPMVLVEALACGTPALVTKIGSMKEIIKDEVHGLHFELGNKKQFIEKSTRLIQNKTFCETMGKNGRKEYLEKYTPEVNYKLLNSIYQDAISNYTKHTFS